MHVEKEVVMKFLNNAECQFAVMHAKGRKNIRPDKIVNRFVRIPTPRICGSRCKRFSIPEVHLGWRCSHRTARTAEHKEFFLFEIFDVVIAMLTTTGVLPRLEQLH